MGIRLLLASGNGTYHRSEQVVYYSTPAFRQGIKQTGAIFRNSATPFLHDETQIDEISWSYMLLQGSRFAINNLLPQVREDTPDCVFFMMGYVHGVSIYADYTSTSNLLDDNVRNSSDHKKLSACNQNSSNVGLLFGTSDSTDVVDGRDQLIPLIRSPINSIRNMGSRSSRSSICLPIMQWSKHRVHDEAISAVSGGLDDRFKFVGPSIVAHSDTASFPFEVPDESSVIYISLGTVFNDKADFYRMCYEAFADIGHTVVLSVGKRTNIANMGKMPRNFIVQVCFPSWSYCNVPRCL